MSGTSLDGVSTALVRLQADPPAATLVAFRQEPYGAAERGAIIDAMARVAPRDLAFLASHGQTVWHEPGKATLQLGDAAVLAERLGVRVVSDFRARDVAAGGQGAPLVPLADVMLFGHEERGRLLLNIGGMANFTWVPRRGVTEGALAFDTGPGVAVIDAVTRRVDPDAAYDVGGERFGIEYAERLLARVRSGGGSENDAVATATALTVESIGRAIARWPGK